jgi:hypothetical protein
MTAVIRYPGGWADNDKGGYRPRHGEPLLSQLQESLRRAGETEGAFLTTRITAVHINDGLHVHRAPHREAAASSAPTTSTPSAPATQAEVA